MKSVKKLITVGFIGTFSLFGCNKTDEPNNLMIVTPTGAPAIAFYNYADNDNFTTNSDPTNIIPMMLNETVDIAVLPTNAGVQAINNKKVNYKIAATITFGNIYIASTGNDINNELDSEDLIISFQKGSVPDKLFNFIYDNKYENSVEYVANVQEAASCLILGKFNNEDVDYVLIAEPALHNVLAKKPNCKVYASIQEEYKKKTNNLDLFQASIFVKNSLEKEVVDTFLSKINYDINAALDNPQLIADGLSKNPNSEFIYGIKGNMAAEVTKTNGMGLGFKMARDNKEGIDMFLSALGIGETNEEIFY